MAPRRPPRPRRSPRRSRKPPIRVPLDQGIPIGPCVTQRKIKIDQHTHRLAERKAFSSRHCLDGARHSGMLRQAGQSYDVETASTVADDVLIKCLIADAAVRRRRLLKADVPNAYSHGKRLGRPLAYMSLPDTLADELLDDEGRRQCIELCSPTWDEGPSGFEWQVELESTLTAMGWRRAPAPRACPPSGASSRPTPTASSSRLSTTCSSASRAPGPSPNAPASS